LLSAGVQRRQQRSIGSQRAQVIPVAIARAKRQAVLLHELYDLSRRHRGPREQPNQVALS
jgi:hypothetical protein